MTDLLSLFDVPVEAAVRVSDPSTSIAAARSIEPGRTERRILEVFGQWPYRGFTDDELVGELERFALYGPTVKTARSRLSKQGRLVDSGKRRLSDRGRDQIVWVLAPSR